MGLVRPVTKTLISSSEFGQPVYDILAALQTNLAGPWVNLTMASGWLAWFSGGYSIPQVRVENFGRVLRFRGLAVRNGGALAIGAQSVVCSFPVSMTAPAVSAMFPIWTVAGVMRVDIMSTRQIQLTANPALADQGFIGLDGLTIAVP